ncbi:MAG: protein arginine kinase [Candidatus Eisenbacteria bacterium]
MTIKDMAKVPSPWLDANGTHSDAVVSSRVRLARNLAGIPFTHRATAKDLEYSLGIAKQALEGTAMFKTGTLMLMSDLDNLERQFLVERHLISQEHAEKSPTRALVMGNSESASVMINEEDHLRLQAMQSGFQVMDAWRLLEKIDAELDGNVKYAFSCEWGYLSACPTNTGTGLRASMLVHLPALVLTGQINKVLHGISQMGLAVRGFYGEGSDVMGNLFQVSNRTALGVTELDIIQSLEKVVRQVLDYEAQARQILLRDAHSQIEDKVWRAYGILKYCRKVTSQEVMSLGSAVRLGKALGVIDSISVAGLNNLLLASQPAHLQKRFSREMDAAERDIVRADMVRKILAEEEARTSAG